MKRQTILRLLFFLLLIAAGVGAYAQGTGEFLLQSLTYDKSNETVSGDCSSPDEIKFHLLVTNARLGSNKKTIRFKSGVKGRFTFTAPKGYAFTEIKLDWDNSNYNDMDSVYTDNGSSAISNPNGDYTWSGSSSQVIFATTAPNNSSSSAGQLKGITFNYKTVAVEEGYPDAPVLSPDPQNGTVYGEQAVRIINIQDGVKYAYAKSDLDGGAAQDYGAEGSTTNWRPYDDHINIDTTKWLTVAAININDTTKVTYTARHYIVAYHDAPIVAFSPEGGTYSGTQTITLTTPNADEDEVTIYYHYRTEGATEPPSTSDLSQWSVYSFPLIVGDNQTIDAFADGNAYYTGTPTSATYIINASEKKNPELSWSNSSVSITMDKADDYVSLAPTLSNPHSLGIDYASTEPGVATINSNGEVTIVGVGTTIIDASYNETTTSEYYSQSATYTLTVTAAAERNVTFYSNSTDNTLSDNDEVPNGTVVKLNIQNYPANYVVRVSLNKTPDYVDSKDNIIIKNTADNFQYIRGTAGQPERGIPIYTSDMKSGKVKINVRLYDPSDTGNSLGESEGSYSISLVVKDYNGQPAPPKAAPETSNNDDDAKTTLTISESATITGDVGNIIYAKYSNNNTYLPRVLLAENNVSIDTTATGVFSSQSSIARRTTAIQVKLGDVWTDGKRYDIASNVMTVYYIYTPNRHATRLDALPNPIVRDISDFSTLGNTAQIDAKFYVDNDFQATMPENGNFVIEFASSNDSVATVSDNGLVTLHNPGNAIITVSTDQIDGYFSGNDTIRGYDAAFTTINVTVTDFNHGKLLPPTFNPPTNRVYYVGFTAKVNANMPNAKYPNAVGNAYYILSSDQSKSYTAEEIVDEYLKAHPGGKGIAPGKTGNVTIPGGDEADDGKQHVIWAVTYNPDKREGNQYSEVSTVTFIYNYIKVNDPVLTPGVAGTDKTFNFKDNQLIVEASTTTPKASIYYTIDQPENTVDITNGTLYDGVRKIQVTTSTIIRAVSYFEGVYSNIVTYRYRKTKTQIDRPTFIINKTGNENYDEDGKEIVRSVTGSSFSVEIRCRVDDNNDGKWDTDYFMPDYDKYDGRYKIYYTIDETMPTLASGMAWTKDSTFENSVTIKAICAASDGSLGLVSTMTVTLTGGVEIWQTSSETCDPSKNGELRAQVISRNVRNANQRTAPNYITMTIGSPRDVNKWSHTTVNETFQGHRIEGFGSYDIIAKAPPSGFPNRTDVMDEQDVLYNHSYAGLNDYSEDYKNDNPDATVKSASHGVYESTFKLPAHGTFVKFEPERDGTIYVWCLQNGGLHYSKSVNNNDRFYNQFIRKRPIYLVDEQGRSVEAVLHLASGTLNKTNWNQIDSANLVGMDGIQDGLLQNLFTKKEAQDIYKMYEDKVKNITGNEFNLTDLVTALNSGDYQEAASAGVDVRGDDPNYYDDVIDGTGYCLPSASYMKYAFPVKAGKTYFFFCLKSKVGICALGFKPVNADETTGNTPITLDETSTSNLSDVISKADAATTYDVTVKHNFVRGIWTSIVLPFSVSETELRSVLGKNVDVVHFTSWDADNKVIHMTRHYYNQMIVAGTPVFVKPDVDATEVTFTGVHIEKNSVEDVPAQTVSSVYMVGSYDQGANLKKHDYYLNKKGELTQLLHSDNKNINGMRAWLRGFAGETEAKTALAFIEEEDKGVVDEVMKVTMDDDGNVVGRDLKNGVVYNLAGQVVSRHADGLRSLPAGVYILNGRKYITGGRQ